jgi:hypothetical protein
VPVRHFAEIPKCPEHEEQGKPYRDEPKHAKKKVEHGGTPVPAFRSARRTVDGASGAEGVLYKEKSPVLRVEYRMCKGFISGVRAFEAHRIGDESG